MAFINSNSKNITNSSDLLGGDVDLDNLTVADTITTKDLVVTNEAIINTLISDLEIEDPLILVGKNNIGNTLNLGILEQFNNTQFSGLVRSKDDNIHYILENVTPAPTPLDNITSLNRGDLRVKILIGDDIASMDSIVGRKLNIANVGLVVRYTLDHELATDDLRILDGALNPIVSLTQTGDLTTIGDITTNNLDVVGDYVNITDGVKYLHNFQYGQKTSARYENSAGGSITLDNRTRGDKTTPTALLSGDLIAIHYFQGHNGGAFDQGCKIMVRCEENWSAGNAGTSYIIQVNNIGTSTLLDKFIVGDDIQILNANLLMNANDISNVGTLDTDVLTVGTTGVDFTFPSARSLTTNQVLKDVLGNGLLSWETETASSETLQEAYDASTSPHITTTDAKGPFTLKHAGDPINDYVLEIKDSVDTVKLSVDKLGGVFSSGFVQTSSILQGNDIRAINSMEMGSGAGISYKLPSNRTGVTDGEMLVLNDATSILEFKKPLYKYNFTQNFTTSNISGTTAEVDITSATGNGSLVIPANSLVAGATYHIKCGGTIENATVSDDLRLRFYLGASVILDTGIIDLPKIGALQPWIFEADLTFRTVGATAGSVFNGQFSFNDAGSYLGKNVVGAGATVDLTASQTWRGTSQWSGASVTNKLYTQILYFYRVS